VTLVNKVATEGSNTAVFASDVTPGRTLVATITQRDNTASVSSPGPDWSLIATEVQNFAGNFRRISMWSLVVASDTTIGTYLGDSRSISTNTLSDRTACVEINGAIDAAKTVSGVFPNIDGNIDCGGVVSPDTGDNFIAIGSWATGYGFDPTTPGNVTPGAGVTQTCGNYIDPCLVSGYVEDTSASGSYRVRFVLPATGGYTVGITVVLVATSTTPVASFTADPEFGDAPLTVAFTDTSTGGTPSAWDWDFGDGGTSTSQNPTHVFTEHGSYTVTLTVTIGGVDYSVSHIVDVTVDVGYTPPLPGLALVEIFATSPGSARWDIAKWDEAVWSSDSWQNVTPESTDVTIIWGSQRPELGILSTPDAASWGIGFFDPLRLLDPANPSSPYFGDIVPGLPVRITHRGWVVKQGVLESAGHNFDLNSFQSHHAGYFRVTDSQSLMARAKVPSDTTLADDLIERARDAIAAAGLTITVRTHVESPGGIEHALVAWEAGTDWSVWQWISDAAAQVLHIPFINRTGELEFREWAKPRDFGKGRDVGKSLASPNLVGLGSVIFVNGTYSVVTVLDEDGVTVRTAEITPKPYYGAVTYDGRLTLPTPNAQDWAQTVLDDRAVAGLRWVPGEVFPLTANDVRYFAEIEPVERVSIDYPEASPQISATGIVVGGQIVISPVQEREARWSFLFQVAATEDQPLVDDDDASFYLVNDDDPSDYLYPG
jgi:PKD repeat protein